MQIIPALNCLDVESLREHIRRAATFLLPESWIHLDVSDGRFTFTRTWNEPERWRELAGQYGWKLEAHLMTEEPEKMATRWLEGGAARIIVHIETVTPESLDRMRAKITEGGAELMLSSNPETPAESFRPYAQGIKNFQALAVNPGLSGQKFLPVVLKKIQFLRELRPDATIEVDGGINLETARLCKSAGADALVASSYIFGSDDPKEAYQELKAV